MGVSTVCDHCRKIMTFQIKDKFVRWLLEYAQNYNDLCSLIDAMEYVFGDIKSTLFIEEKPDE